MLREAKFYYEDVKKIENTAVENVIADIEQNIEQAVKDISYEINYTFKCTLNIKSLVLKKLEDLGFEYEVDVLNDDGCYNFYIIRFDMAED